jgi:hypothetical protein
VNFASESWFKFLMNSLIISGQVRRKKTAQIGSLFTGRVETKLLLKSSVHCLRCILMVSLHDPARIVVRWISFRVHIALFHIRVVNG